MYFSTRVKSISHLKANASELLAHLADQRAPVIITQNGEPKAVLQDFASFQETQKTLALLQVIALGNQEFATG